MLSTNFNLEKESSFSLTHRAFAMWPVRQEVVAPVKETGRGLSDQTDTQHDTGQKQQALVIASREGIWIQSWCSMKHPGLQGRPA